MRFVILAAALAASVSTAALARARTADEAEAARVAQTLNDPRNQDAMADMLGSITDAFMDVRIDRLRAAMARIDPEIADQGDGARTVGDMVTRDDPYARERLDRQSRTAMRAMGSAATGIADMLPAFRRMGEDFSRKVERETRRIERRD